MLHKNFYLGMQNMVATLNKEKPGGCRLNGTSIENSLLLLLRKIMNGKYRCKW